MKKQIIVIITLLAVATVFFIATDSFNIKQLGSRDRGDGTATPFFRLPSFKVPTLGEKPVSEEAWEVFQQYLTYAKAHDTAGVISLSHQLSEVCNDPKKQTECFALMDNVYEVASPFTKEEFSNIQADDRQIIMSTDGPVVAILYFTIDSSGTPKVLGIGFCLEDEAFQERCVETDPTKRDKDNNGWWDAVEALFKETT